MILVSSLVWTHNFSRPEKLFSANLSQLSLGAMSASAFLAATGLTFTRASISTAQISDQSIVTNGAINDAMIGNRTADNAKRGLVLQQTTFNFIGNSPNNTATRDLTVVWTGGTGVTNTTNYAASPDQTNTGCTRVSVTSGGFGNYGNTVTTARRCLSSWQRSTNAISGNGDMQQIWIQSAPADGISTVRAATNTWGRLVTATGATTRQYFTTVDGRDYTAGGGQTARARDVLVDYVQFEKGDWASELTTLGQVKRDSDLLSISSGANFITAQGQIRLYTKFSPKFASTMNVYYQNATGDADATEAGWYLFSWGLSAQNYAYIKASDKKLYVKIANGSEYVSTNAMSFSQYDNVEFFIAVGNGYTSVAQYKLNGGSWVDLVLADVPNVPSPTGSIRLLSNSAASSTADSGHFPCWLHEVAFYNDYAAPSGIPALPPSLSLLGHDLGDYLGGDIISLFGANFTGATGLKVGGTSASFVGATDTRVSFIMPPASTMVRPNHPNFNGTNGRLATALTLDDFFNTNSWSAWVLFNVDAVLADAGGGSRYANVQFFGDAVNAVICMGISEAGVHVVGGSTGISEIVIPCGLGLHVAQAKYDGVNLKLRVDTGPWYSTAATSTSGIYMSNAVRVGANYALNKFFDGRLIDMGFSDTTLSDGTFDNLIGYLNAQHRTAIGGVAPSSFDPATLPLTGWWRAGGYSAGLWEGRASAGLSGVRNLTEGLAIAQPSVSTSGWPGFYDVQFTSPGGRSNTLQIEAWAPAQEQICTVFFDSKHFGYFPGPGAGGGTWFPRHTTVANTSLAMGTGSTANHAASDGAPVFDGDGIAEGSLEMVASLSHLIGPVVASTYQEGSLAAIFKSTSSSPLSTSTPYYNPSVVSNSPQGTVGISFGTSSGVPSVQSHVYDGSYNTRVVASPANKTISVVSRWGQGVNFDLSVDGALTGAGIDSQPTANNNAAHASYTNVKVELGAGYPGGVTEQIFPGTIYAWLALNAKAPDYFVTKFHKWASVRFGTDLPFLASCTHDVADAAGGNIITLLGTNMGTDLGGVVIDPGGSEEVEPFVVSNDGTTLIFMMPPMTPGIYGIALTTSRGTSNTLTLLVEEDPIVWLDAGRAQVSGGLVTDVPNSATSTVNLSVYQSDNSKRPTFNASYAELNGQPAIVSSAGTPVTGLDSVVLSTPIAQPYTIYAVGYMFQAGGYIVDSVDGVHRVAIIAAGSGQAFFYNDGYSQTHGPGIFGHSAVWCSVENGYPNSAIYLEDPSDPMMDVIAFGTGVLDSIKMGNRFSEDSALHGGWGTFAIFAGVHDEATRTRIMGMLRAKYKPNDISGIPHAGLWLSDLRGTADLATWTSWPSVGGTSAKKTLTEATNPPTNGSAVNLFIPQSFNGTNQQFLGPALSTLIEDDGYVWWALFKSDSNGGSGAVTAPGTNPRLWSDNNQYAGASFRSGSGGTEKIQVWHHDGTYDGNEHDITLGAFTLVVARFTGSELRSRVGRGLIASKARGNVGSTAAFVRVASGGGSFWDGETLGLGFIKGPHTDDIFDEIANRVEAKFGLTIT